jgi:hypothetical protein
VAAWLNSDSLVVWKAHTGKKLLTLPGSFQQPFALSRHGRYLAAVKNKPASGLGLTVEQPASEDGPFLCVWELTTGQQLQAIPLPVSSDALLHNPQLVFSPDDRLLALGCHGPGASSEILLWERWTGALRQRWSLTSAAPLTCLAFAPETRHLVSGSEDTSLLIWDVYAPPVPHKEEAAPLSSRALLSAWQDLSVRTGPAPAQALSTLMQAGDAAVALLQKQLSPVVGPSEQQLQGWIKDLGHAKYAVREKAVQELQQLRELAIPALQEALQDNPTLEVHVRLERLLQAADPARLSPGRLQARRALEVLERLGTAQACQLLRRLADGAPEAQLTREARGSLDRMEANQPAAP